MPGPARLLGGALAVAVAVVLAAGPSLASVHARGGAETPPPPDGYTAVESPALPDRLVEVFPDSAFSILIERTGASEEERLMIHRAERLVPTPDRLDAILQDGHRPHLDRGNWPSLLQAARELEAEHGLRWWWMEWDGVLLPIALSAPAVHHHVALLRARAVSANPFGPYDHGGHLAYSARVERVEGDQAEATPWVVVLELRFGYSCGRLCALYFVHDRRVHFDASGTPVLVEGDRAPDVAVS